MGVTGAGSVSLSGSIFTSGHITESLMLLESWVQRRKSTVDINLSDWAALKVIITDFQTILFIMIHLIKSLMTTLGEVNVLLPISTHCQIATLCLNRRKETYGSL